MSSFWIFILIHSNGNIYLVFNLAHSSKPVDEFKERPKWLEAQIFDEKFALKHHLVEIYQ